MGEEGERGGGETGSRQYGVLRRVERDDAERLQRVERRAHVLRGRCLSTRASRRARTGTGTCRGHSGSTDADADADAGGRGTRTGHNGRRRWTRATGARVYWRRGARCAAARSHNCLREARARRVAALLRRVQARRRAAQPEKRARRSIMRVLQ